jgi:hypothetical protein
MGQCNLCPTGSYQSVGGATACIRCTAPSFCPEGASLELPANCPPRTYANMSDSDGIPQCFDCLAGHFCAGGAAPMRNCSAGSYAASQRTEECSLCAGGAYQPLIGQTACIECPSGSHCAEGASAALLCESGSYRSTPGATGPHNCATCPAGSACSTGATLPVPCEAGTFAGSDSQDICRACGAGTFQNTSGMSACYDCTAGKLMLGACERTD